MSGRVLYLAGGVGGSKLAMGLARTLSPDKLTVVVNTGDDEEFHGLHVSPDLDTVMYALAGLTNEEAGWGITGDTFNALGMLERYGASTWFNLGDRDFATHIRRTELLREGRTLSEVTRELCQHLGVEHAVAPMSDDPVRTAVTTPEGVLPFQDYFVRLRCEPRVVSVEFRGAEEARPSPGFLEALEGAEAVIYGPSNPLVSLGPILAVCGVRERLASFGGKRIAVSPIVGGQALRGPAAKMLRELGEEPGVGAIARRLAGVCDSLVVDEADRCNLGDVEAAGMAPVVLPTVMRTLKDRETLARCLLELL